MAVARTQPVTEELRIVTGVTTAGVLVIDDQGVESVAAALGTGELLVEDGGMEFLFDDTTGDVLYEG